MLFSEFLEQEGAICYLEARSAVEVFLTKAAAARESTVSPQKTKYRFHNNTKEVRKCAHLCERLVFFFFFFRRRREVRKCAHLCAHQVSFFSRHSGGPPKHL